MKDEKRFEILEKQGLSLSREAIILRDRQTGVQYLYVANGYGGGLTPLLGADGKPVINSYGM